MTAPRDNTELLARAEGWERIALVILPVVVNLLEDWIRDRSERRASTERLAAELPDRQSAIETATDAAAPNPANRGSGVRSSSAAARAAPPPAPRGA